MGFNSVFKGLNLRRIWTVPLKKC